ncbi:MAG: hypothetical protein IJT61_09515 [Bacteroidales bacterium]|nr:hypothetical protein [Bacteroidales bacterium]
MKIALFSAVAEEAGAWAPRFHFTGIGRENATRSMLDFITRHQGEEYTIVNVGTVGSHAFPVGTILSIDEIVSAGSPFNDFRMQPTHFQLPPALDVPHATLYSSDSFVAPEVYTEDHLALMKRQAQCFDMESSAAFSVATSFGIPYVSFKIVSDNLDVTIDIWRERVVELSKKMDGYLKKVLENLGAEVIWGVMEGDR